jgi:hypothetical protein
MVNIRHYYQEMCVQRNLNPFWLWGLTSGLQFAEGVYLEIKTWGRRLKVE